MSASGRVRAVVLVVLLGDVAGATALVASLVAPRTPAGTVAVVAVLAVHTAVHALGLRAAVTPWVEDRARGAWAVALLLVTAAAWPVLVAAAGPGDEPWAWLAGFSVGALAVLRPPVAALGALGVVVAALAGPGDPRDGLVFAAVAALASGALMAVVVWMFGVLRRAEEGREAQARLAVAEERLRMSRDLHDVLSHRLGVLALRAELAGDHESQELASRTLAEVRTTVHGYGTVDLAEQLTGAELVLGSAGIDVTVRSTSPPVSAAASQLLAAAVREGVTNVLRHSRARRCRVVLEDDGPGVHLTIANDGVGPAPSGPTGTGLAGLAERARLLGARVRAERDEEEFRLTVELAP
ncbi:sensor histidine kinase [Actinomycetospora atypica]|uniref:Sensor histidine kinase n=1 Tax=Actinomycetospora atypica TaxID=1290095 RepID=A0ABV9YW85_9PSEU